MISSQSEDLTSTIRSSLINANCGLPDEEMTAFIQVFENSLNISSGTERKIEVFIQDSPLSPTDSEKVYSPPPKNLVRTVIKNVRASNPTAKYNFYQVVKDFFYSHPTGKSEKPQESDFADNEIADLNGGLTSLVDLGVVDSEGLIDVLSVIGSKITNLNLVGFQIISYHENELSIELIRSIFSLCPKLETFSLLFTGQVSDWGYNEEDLEELNSQSKVKITVYMSMACSMSVLIRVTNLIEEKFLNLRLSET